ncbi:type IV secretory pathway VirB4 protein-like protein, partial [mine drainage metagenome]
VECYPATLPYGWLLPFLTAQARVDVVLHLHAVSQDLSRGLLNNEITRLQVELLGKREKGTTDVSALEHQVAAFEELRASLVRGDERLFLTGLYLGIRAETDEALDALAGKVQSTLRGLLVSANDPPLPSSRSLPDAHAVRARLPSGDTYPLPPPRSRRPS